MKTHFHTCLTCSRSLPTSDNFPAHANICGECKHFSSEVLILMAIDKVEREHKVALSAVSLRKMAKVTDYLLTGKRCQHGHHYKQPAEFDKCASRGDGLQPACRACNKLRVSLLNCKGAHDISGQGLRMWHTARDAMRKQAAIEQANPTIPAPIHYNLAPSGAITQVPPAPVPALPVYDASDDSDDTLA